MDVAVRTRELKGECANGDSFLDYHASDFRLFSVVDGLGHGPQANFASTTAVELIRKNRGLDLNTMFAMTDLGLRQTRGVAVAIAKFDTHNKILEFGGVGNVEFYSNNKNIKPISYGGILGHSWRQPKIFKYDYSRDDLFVMFSDGISTRFNLDEFNGQDSKIIAMRIMDQHSKDHDDATVMVIRI